MQTGEIGGVPDGVVTEAAVGYPAERDPAVVGPTGGEAGGDGRAEPGGSTAPDSVDAVDHLLDEVEQALSRLDDGTYGECATCGEPIDDVRLTDDPAARECSSCTAQRDG